MHHEDLKFLSDVLGWIGALLFLISYLLLILKRWKPTSIIYHVFNIAAGIFTGISAWYDFSFPSAFINLVWAAIAIFGLYSDHWRSSITEK